MPSPYRARLNERHFLNLPGFHGGAYVVAYVEDTSGRRPEQDEYEPDWVHLPRPRVILELADCDGRINLEFDVHSPLQRENSLHKITTLLDTLGAFRGALAAECALYEQRERDQPHTRSGRRRGRTRPWSQIRAQGRAR